MSSILDKIFTHLVLWLLLPPALLPLRLARRVGAGIGLLAFLLAGSLRRKVVARVAASLPTIARINPAAAADGAETIARRFFANLGRFFVEVVRIHFGFGRQLLDQVEFRGVEHYRAAKNAGRGVIFVTAHCGNWEASALAFGLQFEPMAVVVRHQQSAEVTGLLERLRCRYGNQSILKDGAARRVLSMIRSGGVVGILSDIAVPQREGILTEFLGRPAWTTPMPAVIAQKTGCTLLPGFIRREGERLVVEFHAPIPTAGLDIATITATVAQQIEAHIASYPEEWFWLYHRWKNAPETMSAATSAQTL